MNFLLTIMTFQKTSIWFITKYTCKLMLFRFDVFSFDVFILNFPIIMDEKTEIVSIVMRWSIGNCSYHESFFSWTLADITKSCLAFFVIWSSTKSASMTSFINFLAIFMNSHRTLRAFLNGITHFRKITKACWTRCTKIIFWTFV
jgi:hypothetical protein